MTIPQAWSALRSRLPVLPEGSGLAAIAQVVRTLAALISVPLTIGYLGREAYGLWMLTLSALSILTIVDAGLSPPAKNRMAEAFALEDAETFRLYGSGVIVLGSFLALAGLVAVPVVAAFDWGTILGLSEPLARLQARPLVVSAAALGFASLSLAGVEAIYAARLRIGTVAAASMVASAASLLLLLAATSARAPLWTLPAASVGPVVLARGVLLLRLWAEDRRLVTAALGRMRPLLRDVLPAATAFIAIQGASAAITAIPSLLLARHGGVASVAQFSVAFQIAYAPLTLLAAVLPAYWPTFTVAWTRRDLGQLRETLRRNIAVSVVALLAYAAALLPFGGPLASIWTRGTIDVPLPLFAALGVWLVSLGTAHWLATLLNAISDLRFQVLFTAIHATTLAVLARLLVPAFGIAGAGASMAVAVSLTWTLPLLLRVRGLLARGQNPASDGRAVSSSPRETEHP